MHDVQCRSPSACQDDEFDLPQAAYPGLREGQDGLARKTRGDDDAGILV
jgi:hypothetical protein